MSRALCASSLRTGSNKGPARAVPLGMTNIADEHPELFHYTTAGGLEGILGTQTLWATHARYLNDTSEMTAFSDRLPEFLGPAVDAGIEPLLKFQANQKFLVQLGGREKLVEHLTREASGAIYAALLGSPDTAPYIEPYIISFCTTDKPRVSEHGLLSQWRGYGRDGGYALVFDTARLDALLAEEAGRWTWGLSGGDVVYSTASAEEVRQELGNEIDAIKGAIVTYLASSGSSLASLEPMYEAITQCVSRYKHWGFEEEHEVRIVAIPANQSNIQEMRRLGHVVSEIPRHTFLRNGTTVRCVHLFEGLTSIPSKTLPIKRIIVGPHVDKEKRRRALDIRLQHLGLDVRTSVSEIPYAAHP
jgi:DUF2971 family protein